MIDSPVKMRLDIFAPLVREMLIQFARLTAPT